MSDDDVSTNNPYFLVDPYREFLRDEAIPVIEEYAVDVLSMDLKPWSRLGGKGAYVHLTGRGDFCSAYVVEIPPGGQLEPEQHLCDKEMYVFSGRGSTVIELPNGRKHTFEWGPGSLFGIPLNARHQLFNGSGTEPARLAALTDLPLYLNLVHNRDFIFNNPYVFQERLGEERYFAGEGEFRKVRPGRHQWETNFVPDLLAFELPEWKERGAGGRNIFFTLADSPLHCHISQFPVGTYKKGHYHNAGAHIFIVSGHGYSLLWRQGESPVESVKVDWRVGSLFAPPDGPTYHQHFNTSNEPARYLVFGFGSPRYRVLESSQRDDQIRRVDKSVEEGGRQIEYDDEDPRIFQLYRQECANAGIAPRMHEFLGARAR